MARAISAEVRFRDVFQHTAANAEALRETIVNDIDQCIGNARILDSHPRLEDARSDLRPDLYLELKRKYDPLLYHGTFNLRKKLSDDLIWKWTEATGKYVGCPFGSRGAKVLFDEASAGRGNNLPLRDAVNIAIRLSRRSRPKASRIAHEHVYPKASLRILLSSSGEVTRVLFDRVCVSCVVLESEHIEINRLGSPNKENPWMRYAPAGIRLVDNPEWPALQRNLISEAGLLS